MCVCVYVCVCVCVKLNQTVDLYSGQLRKLSQTVDPYSDKLSQTPNTNTTCGNPPTGQRGDVL